jgi:CBS domain-containing protein
MKLKEIMTRNIEVVHPNDSLQTAARKMRDRDVGVLPVLDGDQLVGMLSDRDITLRAVAEGANPKAILGRELMTSPVISCFDDQDVKEAARIMEENQIRRVAVLDRKNEQLVGIVSLSDLAKTQDHQLYGEVLQKVSKP